MNKIWARWDRHSMVAEAPGAILLSAASIGMKGQAQHLTRSNLCAGYPQERATIFSFPTFVFSHFLQIRANDHMSFIALAIHLDQLMQSKVQLYEKILWIILNGFNVVCLHCLKGWYPKAGHRGKALNDWQDDGSICNNWQKHDKTHQDEHPWKQKLSKSEAK